ncbi:MAG TPA: serine/threonine-protein kinase [Haliangiales bacterium]|nr:serine/threonine-protein kinase [Haliangiales bacterium]
MIGRVVAERYRIVDLLGQGGMGAVYRARHLALGRDVAVKLVHEDVAGRPTVAERFRREALILARLNHENAVHIYDFGVDEGSLYIVMELVDGRTVDSVVAAEGRLAPERVVRAGDAVCAVLEVAHAAGIVHRDIKPSNIMLCPRGDEERIKVLDFGMATLREEGDIRLTRDGQVFGTPAYMSPEQAQARRPDGRSDIYSLGCVLYEMVTGHPPFPETGGAMQLLMAHAYRAPIPPRKLVGDDVPPGLEAVILKAMAKLPAHRFSDAREMREALAPSLTAAPAPPPARPAREAAAPRREPHFAAVTAQENVTGAVAVWEPPEAAAAGVGTALGGMGHDVTNVSPGEDLAPYGALVVVGAAGDDALALAQAFARAPHAPPVLLCGPEDDLALMTRSIEVGIHDYVPLPLDASDLAKKVARALRARR